MDAIVVVPPRHAADNRPERLEAALRPTRREGLLPVFPLGSEMTQVERSLIGPLAILQSASRGDLLRIF
jgi:hypothetical protein